MSGRIMHVLYFLNLAGRLLSLLRRGCEIKATTKWTRHRLGLYLGSLAFHYPCLPRTVFCQKTSKERILSELWRGGPAPLQGVWTQTGIHVRQNSSEIHVNVLPRMPMPCRNNDWFCSRIIIIMFPMEELSNNDWIMTEEWLNNDRIITEEWLKDDWRMTEEWLKHDWRMTMFRENRKGNKTISLWRMTEERLNNDWRMTEEWLEHDWRMTNFSCQNYFLFT